MIQERRRPIKGLHQAISQLQQKSPHKKKNSPPRVTPLLKLQIPRLQKLPRCQNPKMTMMKVFQTLLYHQKCFPQKIQRPLHNPIADHNFKKKKKPLHNPIADHNFKKKKKKKNFLVYQNIITCFNLYKCIYNDAYIVARPDMC